MPGSRSAGGAAPRAAASSSPAHSVACGGNSFDHDWKIADARDPGNVLQAKNCGVLDRGKEQSGCGVRSRHPAYANFGPFGADVATKPAVAAG